MKTRNLVTLLLVAGLLSFAGCGGEDAGSAGDPGLEVDPTQDALVGTLRDLLAAIEAGDLVAAAAHMHPFPNMSPEDVQQALPGFVEKREISGAGIDVLAEKGAFGSLAEIFPDRGAGWAERVGADPAKCYALSHEGAEVAALWNGSAFLLLRLDDVGKLE